MRCSTWAATTPRASCSTSRSTSTTCAPSGAPSDRAAARTPLGRAYAEAGATAARPLAEEIEALARRGRIPLDDGTRTDADAAPADASAADRLGLTARELDVLGLIAQGHTNRQIGEQLFISDKTASVHVSRILAKLDAANRGEAAAIARRLGLVAA